MKKTLLVAAGFLGSSLAVPVLADQDIEALKRELAEQKVLIERLLSAQQAEQEANSKARSGAPLASVTSAKEPVSGQPESSLVVYGVADVSVTSMDSGLGRKTSFGSGGLASSRLGVKGARGVGDGLKVIGVAEAGVLIDTGSTGNGAVASGINTTPSTGGALGTGSQLFSRQIYFGMSSDRWGSLTLGRQYAGSYMAAGYSNALGFGLYGYSGGILPTVGMPTRLHNSVVYQTPKLSGLAGIFTYSTGNENNVSTDIVTAPGATTRTNDKAGRALDAMFLYANGPFSAVGSAWRMYNTTYVVPASGPTESGLAVKTGLQLGGSYDFGLAKVYGDFVSGKISGANYENVTRAWSKSSGWSVSGLVPLGKHKLLASYTKFDDKSALNRDAQLLGLGYTYDFYSNTKLYASWGKMMNNEKATYSLPDGGNLVGSVTTPGFSPVGYMAGLNVVF